MTMNDYKKTDAWEYIKRVSNGKDTSKIKEKIYGKYKNTSFEFFYMEYELTNLAEMIVKSEEFENVEQFLKLHSKKIQDAIYSTGLDHYIMEAEKIGD